MKILEALGLKRKASVNIKPMLPTLNAWVDLHYGGSAVFHVVVEEIGSDAIVTSHPDSGRLRPGATGTFLYTNSQGKFRFASLFLGEDPGGRLRFALPERVTSLGGGGANQRAAVRLDATVQGMWRMAAGGKGVGEFTKATVRDISRGGVALIIPAQLRKTQEIEVQLPLSDGPPLQAICEVMRIERIERSGKYSHGVRFKALRPFEERAVADFINKRQADLRARGLA
ncbi:PilZ domain-containing protein [bacterium]|nr:MAG: PilZ domain-containing protein [bacterium]